MKATEKIKIDKNLHRRNNFLLFSRFLISKNFCSEHSARQALMSGQNCISVTSQEDHINIIDN